MLDLAVGFAVLKSDHPIAKTLSPARDQLTQQAPAWRSELVTSSLLSLIYAAGLSQAGFLVCALSALRVRHSAARWLLVAVILVFSILLAEEFLDAIGLALDVGLGLAVEFALGPLLYFFIKALVQSGAFSVRRAARHFIPLGVAGLVLVWLNLGFSGGVSLSNPAVGAIITLIVFVKIAYFFLYAAAALRLPLPADASPARLRALTDLRRLFAVCVGVYAISALSFVAFVFHVPLAPDSDIVGGIILALSLFAIGYFALVNRDVFDLRDPYEATSMSAEEASQIQSRARAHMAKSAAYLDPELSLRGLAAALGLKAARLSQALNSADTGGFKALINQYRLSHYLAARADAANRDKTTLELAFEAGFNSKATFYRVLKAAETSAGETRVASAPQAGHGA